MKREELIDILSMLYEGIPEGASSYHICDILIGKAERLGMLPPETVNSELELKYCSLIDYIDKNFHYSCIDHGKEYYVNEWDKKDQDEEL